MTKTSAIMKEILSFAITLLITWACVSLFYRFVAKPVLVDGHSMDYTLQDGERMIMNRLSKPERFDVVVVPSPVNDKLYIKRIIGMPGDRLEFKDDELILNGIATQEPYLADKQVEFPDNFTPDATLEEMTGEVVVPEGKIFVVGDNRRNSYDSRSFGFLNLDDVIGKTQFVYWPLAEFGTLTDYELNTDGQIVTP